MIKFMHRKDVNSSRLTDMQALSHLTRFWSQNLCGLSSASSNLPIHEVGNQTVTSITRVLQLPGVCVGYGYLLILASGHWCWHTTNNQVYSCDIQSWVNRKHWKCWQTEHTTVCCWHKSTHNIVPVVEQTTRCIVVTYSHESTTNIESVDRQNTQQCVCWHKNTHNVVPVGRGAMDCTKHMIGILHWTQRTMSKEISIFSNFVLHEPLWTVRHRCLSMDTIGKSTISNITFCHFSRVLGLNWIYTHSVKVG